MNDISTKKGLLAVSPVLVFLILLVLGGCLTGDFSSVPIVTAFLVASVYAVAMTRGVKMNDRIKIFGRGAGNTNIMLMIWIFILAGAFSASASSMGCIDNTVNALLTLLPPKWLLVSIFIAGCFISMATGSGMGTIVAIGPVAVGISQMTGESLPLLGSVVVCSAMFGDNLSFISDTTVIATTTQGCELKDKFRANIWLALPAALCVMVVYYFIGGAFDYSFADVDINYLKIIPYVAVIAMAVSGVDVMLTLVIGTLICGVMGMIMGDFNVWGWAQAVSTGIEGMGGMIIIVLLAAGLMALVKHNGGMNFIVNLCLKFVRGRRSAEACICVLTGLVCCCTANNTIAIVGVADVVKDLSSKYGIEPRRAASLLDTSSCVTLELIPYSSHLLCMAGIAQIAASSLLPYMYYAFMLGIVLTLSIVFPFKSRSLTHRVKDIASA